MTANNKALGKKTPDKPVREPTARSFSPPPRIDLNALFESMKRRELLDAEIDAARAQEAAAKRKGIASAAQEERHQKSRADCLAAAVYCLVNFPPSVGRMTATALAKLVEEKAPLFWPEAGEPPLGREALCKHFATALKFDEKNIRNP